MLKTLFNILLISIALLLSIEGFSQKIDTIYHINGNILTGDLKKMNYGVVSWSMDGLGTNNLEEPKIKTIKSIKQFEIKLKSGLVYFGSIDTSNQIHHVNIVIANGRELVDINNIVEIYPIRKSFWRRTSGNFSVGVNYSKGSDIATIALSGNINYRKRHSYFYITYDANTTFQADTLNATKADATIGWQRTLQNKWSTGLVFGAGQNSQLGTRLRLDITGLGIRDFIYNKWNRFYSGAGLSVQRETPFEGEIINDLVGIATIVWKVYKYTRPKVWVDTDITFVPYITGDWRYRTVANLNPKISVVADDLKVGFKFYYTFDSAPQTDAATAFDWGINFELTYTLH